MPSDNPPETPPRYYDVMLRHQLMLERVKGFYYREFNKYLNRLAKELRPILRQHDNYGNLTRRQLQQLRAEVDRAQAAVWESWRTDTLARARQLMVTDRRLASQLLAATQQGAGRRLSAKAFLDRASDPETLWAHILAEPLGATGQTLEAMLEYFTTGASVRIGNEVGKGYANNLDGATVAENIIGNAEANTGLFRTLRTQSRAVIATGLQHVSQETHHNVQKATYDTYRWVSVLDDRTTDICRHRNGKIFEYGKGPMPPAHFHCRSTIVPAITGSTPREDQNDIDEWLAEQLAKTVVGMLGTRLHNTREAIASAHMRPMTIDQFGRSGDIMTGRQ